MGLSGQLDRISRAVPRRLVGKEHNKIIGVDYTGGNVSLYRPVTAMISRSVGHALKAKQKRRHKAA